MNIGKMSLTELKELAKKNGIKNISKFKKDELLEKLSLLAEMSIKKISSILVKISGVLNDFLSILKMSNNIPINAPFKIKIAKIYISFKI